MTPRNLAMRNANRFKLGIFAANCSSGLAVTKAPERWQATWDNNVRLARMADEVGIEFLLPIARWRGYGGATDFEGEAWETLSWACGLLAATRNITVFGTVHAPLVHPIFAAKQIVTIDHVAQGRFGLNIVCGWNQDEFDMFGAEQREHDERYAFGEEWLAIIRRLWTEEIPFDFAGRWFKLTGAIGKPRPWGGAAPAIMNAGASTAGRAFGARNCDFVFTKLVEPELGEKSIATIRAEAQRHGRAVGVYCSTHLVVRKTRAEAEAYYRRYAEELADWEGVDRLILMQGLYTQSLPAEDYTRLRRRFSGGHGTYPIVGDPDHVASEIARISAAGFTGATIAFVDYLAELPYFAAEVIPRLERLGLRRAVAEAGAG